MISLDFANMTLISHIKWVRGYMQNISVYVNERASNGSLNWKEQIDNALFRSDISYKNPKNLDELYSSLALDIEKNVDVILSIGGDGTVHQLIQQLAGTDVNLMVIPGGTANDLAHILGSSANVKKIAQTIRTNSVKKIDLISINGTFMATNGGLGFAAEVAGEMNQLRQEYPGFKQLMKASGKSIYSILVAKKMLSREIKSYKFKISSEEFNSVVYSPLVLINNQPILGGHFKVAPYTDHQDGKVNFTIFKHENRLELVQCILKVMSGNFPKDDKNLVFFETEKADIELLEEENPISFFGDGESFLPAKKWEVRCFHRFLNVYSPKDQKELGDICTEVSIL